MRSLATFRNGAENRGRANLYAVNGGYLLVDYGHNIGAFHAICEMTSQWHGVRVTGVVTVPGDRSDELISEAARVVACGFDRLIIREDDNKRGRKPGEIAAMLERNVRNSHPELEVEVVPDERDAYAHAISTMQPNEVLVFFYDNYAYIQSVLEEYAAEAVEYPERLLADLQATGLREVA
jgi:cyanophycin synthetase